MAAVELDDSGIVTVCPACGQKNRLHFNRLDAATRCAKCRTPLSPPSTPIDIPRSADFDRLIASSSVPVVVDFWAPWCGPCRMVAPEIEKVAAKHAGRYLVAKVNTDALSDIGDRLQIRSIPTMAVFAGGREVARTTGARPAPDIEAFIENATKKVELRR